MRAIVQFVILLVREASLHVQVGNRLAGVVIDEKAG